MDAKFLDFYNQELSFIRESAAEFAKEYPKIAGRLGLEGFDCSDPYVERLLEGFAFLSARVHRKLESSFPEFTQNMLELLFPTLLQPLPSMLVTEFSPDLEEGSLLNGAAVKKHTSLFSLLGKDEQTPCEYRTAKEVRLWPITLTEAEYLNTQDLSVILSQEGVSSHLKAPIKSAIRLTIETPPNLKISDLSLDTLHLHLRGTESFPFYVFEALYKGFQGLLYKSGESLWRVQKSETNLSCSALSQEQALLPYSQRQYDGFRILRELFAFPQRFLFLDIENLQTSIQTCQDHKLTLLLLLDHADPRLENRLGRDNFALHSAPAINLFPKRAERINLSRHAHELHVVPDRLKPLDFEVCAIEKVTGYGSAIDQITPITPLYSPSTSSVSTNVTHFTYARRTRSMSVNERKFGHRSSYVGTEVYLDIVDPNSPPYPDELRQLAVDTLCCNRDLPLMMPLGKSTTDFTTDTSAPCTSIRCLGEPTRPTPPLNKGNVSWDLINLLSVNFLGFDNQGHGALDSLKKLLALMIDKNNHSLAKQIEGLIALEVKQISARLPFPGPICFGRGVEIRLTVDESAFEGSSAFLLGLVLDNFFAQYVSVNAFSRFVLCSSERGEVHTWPIRTGLQSAI